MTVKIDSGRCTGCPGAKEPPCVKVCPGDLLYADSAGRCAIRDPADCWDCAACLKECPRQAIYLSLPVLLGGRGSTLQARTTRTGITWRLMNPEGKEEVFRIRTKNSQYSVVGSQ